MKCITKVSLACTNPLVIVPMGTEIIWDKNAMPYIKDTKISLSVEYTLALLNLQAPSLQELEHYVFDGIAESILGEQVEPDGFDEFGSPSWLLVLGYV